MAGTKIEGALDRLTDSVTQTGTLAEKITAASSQAVAASAEATGTLGIKGFMWNNLGNVGAMAIIAGAFLYLQREQVTQAREDRVMFRESIAMLNTSADKRFERSEVTHGKAMEKMETTIEKAVDSLEGAVREMKATTEEVRKVRVMGSVKGPGG